MDILNRKLWTRCLETLAVLIWIVPVFVVTFGSIMSIYVVFCTKYSFIPFLYLGWMIYDRHTCKSGGRRLVFLRRLPIWTKFCDYFSLKLIKTVDLDPSKNYLFCGHPHGILSAGIFGNFGTEGRNVRHIFPHHRMSILTMDTHCHIPLQREFLLLAGICSSSKESMNYLLSTAGSGQIVILIPGGRSEALDSHPNSYVLHLKNRKGFIKVALRNGSPLVPVFTFGETDLFHQLKNPRGSRLRRVQNKLLELIKIPMMMPTHVVPNRVPVTTVVGAPIVFDKIDEPSQEDIDTLHASYVDALSKLFYTYRDEYAPNPKVDLTII